MNYLEMVQRANKGELSAKDINEIVVIMAKNERDQDKRITQNGRGLTDIKEEYPLLPPEADDLSKVVRAKGVEVMGGKKSAAYKNATLRRKVYQDIYSEIKRQFGLFDEKGFQVSYKKLKRKHLSGAFDVVGQYALPAALEEEVISINEAGELDED